MCHVWAYCTSYYWKSDETKSTSFVNQALLYQTLFFLNILHEILKNIGGPSYDMNLAPNTQAAYIIGWPEIATSYCTKAVSRLSLPPQQGGPPERNVLKYARNVCTHNIISVWLYVHILCIIMCRMCFHQHLVPLQSVCACVCVAQCRPSLDPLQGSYASLQALCVWSFVVASHSLTHTHTHTNPSLFLSLSLSASLSLSLSLSTLKLSNNVCISGRHVHPINLPT